MEEFATLNTFTPVIFLLWPVDKEFCLA